MQDSSLTTRRSKSVPKQWRSISLPGVFVIFTLMFGLAMAFVTPPFLVADEPQHLLRAYQISEFEFFSTFRGGKGGGSLPTSIAIICQPYHDVRYSGKIASAELILKTLQIPLRSNECSYYEFPNTAVYSPLAYIPQSIAIGIGRSLHLTTLSLMYLARVANLLLWTGCGYWALRLAPGLRRPMFLLMMMPMALYEAASISIDASSVSIALLLAALVWREAMEQNDKRVSWPVLVSFCLLSIGLGLTKFVYLPLIGLILLIPSRRFGGKWRRTAAFAIILFVGFAGEILWAVHTPGLDAALVPGSAPHQFVARGQLAFLRQHPSAWLSVPLKTIAESWWSVTVSFVGNLGWLNAPLSGIFCVIYLAALLLACVPSADEPKLETFGPWIAIIIAVIAVCLFAIGFTEYIYWNLVGWGYIRGLQGRYGIPLAPAAFMLIWVSWQRLPRKFWSHRTGWEREALCVLLAACGSVYALFVIYSRFYVG